MGIVSDIEEKVKDYLEGDYEIIEKEKIPSVEDCTFGKKAYKMKLTTFSIDLRNSTNLMFIGDKETSGKIHKSFLTVVASIINYFDGQIRSFNGDGLLAFWEANSKSDIDNAVKTAMTIKWLLDIKLSAYFEKFSKIDFGIGIDWSETYILRSGVSRNDNNNDLVFIGSCVNFATEIANQAKSPDHVEISKNVYDNLTDDWKYGIQNNNKVDMWRPGIVKWNGVDCSTKVTNWYHSLD